jgi:hypothetical protein
LTTTAHFKKVRATRISRAISGFRIPMMSIPQLGRDLDAAMMGGATDEELQALVARFPGVTVAPRVDIVAQLVELKRSKEVSR